MSVGCQINLAQVAKRLSMGERQLLNLNRHGVLSSLIFTNNSGVHYFDQAWPRKAPIFRVSRKGI